MGVRRRSKRHNSLGSGFKLEKPLVVEETSNSDVETRRKTRPRRSYIDRDREPSPKVAPAEEPTASERRNEEEEKIKARVQRRYELFHFDLTTCYDLNPMIVDR